MHAGGWSSLNVGGFSNTHHDIIANGGSQLCCAVNYIRVVLIHHSVPNLNPLDIRVLFYAQYECVKLIWISISLNVVIQMCFYSVVDWYVIRCPGSFVWLARILVPPKTSPKSQTRRDGKCKRATGVWPNTFTGRRILFAYFISGRDEDLASTIRYITKSYCLSFVRDNQMSIFHRWPQWPLVSIQRYFGMAYIIVLQYVRLVQTYTTK